MSSDQIIGTDTGTTRKSEPVWSFDVSRGGTTRTVTFTITEMQEKILVQDAILGRVTAELRELSAKGQDTTAKASEDAKEGKLMDDLRFMLSIIQDNA